MIQYNNKNIIKWNQDWEKGLNKKAKNNKVGMLLYINQRTREKDLIVVK